MTDQRHDVIIIGGGQAGLAIGHLLARRDRQLTILDAAGAPAAAWRARWDSLKLFTPVRYDSLPGRAFPGPPDAYPGRDDVVAYLTDYARDFELPVELNSRVRSLRHGEDGFVVELEDRTYEAPVVVVATGPFQVPRVPAVAERLASDTAQVHSSAYRTRPAASPMGRCSWSAAATPAIRSPKRSRAPTRCTSRSGPAKRRCRNASPAATSSATSKQRA